MFQGLFVRIFVSIGAGFLLNSSSPAEQTTSQESPSYSKLIARAQSELDAGRISAARECLESTDESLRSFEYEYLMARANAAREDGPAPDLIRTLNAPKVPVRYGVLNEESGQLAFICGDGSIRVHNLRDEDAPVTTVSHEGGAAVWSGAFSHDGRTFVAGFEGGEVGVWDATTWQRRLMVSVSGEKPVRELAVAPDGSAFVAEGSSALELWSLGDGEPVKLADVGDRLNFGEGLAFSPAGNLIATGGMFDIHVHDARTGELRQTMTHASYTMGLNFSPDGTRIASAPKGNVNKFLAVFDVEGGEPLFNAGPFPCFIHGGVFSPDGKRVLSAACEKVPSLQLFDSTTGELVFSLRRKATGIKPAFTHDGRILGWSERGGFRFIDLGGSSKEAPQVGGSGLREAP